jgi:signal transduction histidine kinase/ActR/RegA family two-component response regulator
MDRESGETSDKASVTGTLQPIVEMAAMPLIQPHRFVPARLPPPPPERDPTDTPAFLQGSGEVAHLLRTRDWQANALGPTWLWPQSLRTVVRLLLNTRFPMLVFWGASHACLYNDAFAAYVGPERHPSSLGQPAHEVWGEIWSIVGPQIELVMRGGGATWHENQIIPITRGGRRQDMYWTYSFSPVDDEMAPNGIGGVLVVCTETTRQVLAERQQAESAAVTAAERDRLAQLFAQAPGFMALLTGSEHRIDLANQAFLQLIGHRPVLGLPVAEALPELAEQGYLKLLDQVFETGQAFAARSASYLVPTDAEAPPAQVFIDYIYQPFRNERAEVIGIFVQGFDSTGRSRAEARLRELNETLEQRVAAETAERSKTEDALRQALKMEAVGQLTGGIAHDFNNMLQGMVTALDLAERRFAEGRPEEARPYLITAQNAAFRAGGLTARLLAFGRRQALDPRPVALDELVQGMLSLIRQTVGTAVQIDLRLRDPCWLVLADANQLESVLLNLAINARDAMQPRPGRLIIATAHVMLDAADLAGWDSSEPGEYVRITVTDTGCGMPPDVAAHAFEPFFTTKPEGQGTGLGLSQLYGFVRQSQGIVRLESTPGAGTSVHLFLPRCHERPGDAARDAAATQPEEAAADSAATVLLVEDEVALRQTTAEGLREAGFNVLQASDASEALKALAEAAAVDVLVADVGLPNGLNGRQLADAARTLMPGLPVLLISGFGGDAVSGSARLQRGMSMLVKPFKLEELTRRIETMIGLRRSG